jgi:hypothetical protein
MGLTIHYSARLKNPKQLPELVAEVSDICRSMDWKYHTFEPDENEGEHDVSGIILNPHPDCEPVWLTFRPDGVLTTPIMEQMRKDGEYDFSGAFTKTQFAGPQTHIVVVKLLKYVAGKYLDEVKVTDEGNYWETESVEVLRGRFEVYIDVFDRVFDALEKTPFVPGESVQDLAARLEEVLKGVAERYEQLRKKQ